MFTAALRDETRGTFPRVSSLLHLVGGVGGLPSGPVLVVAGAECLGRRDGPRGGAHAGPRCLSSGDYPEGLPVGASLAPVLCCPVHSHLRWPVFRVHDAARRRPRAGTYAPPGQGVCPAAASC